MMRVALDATPLTLSSGGIRRYTEELARALARGFPEDRVFLASDQEFGIPADPPGNLRVLRKPAGGISRRWWGAGLPLALRRDGVDVFHGTDFAVPYLPVCPAVMTVHDLSPWKNRAWHAAASRVRQRAPRLLGLGLADMVITPSEAVRREAVEEFRLAPGRAVAVPLAAADRFRRVEEAPSEPYFLYVGVIEPRKNLLAMVEAWREAARESPVSLLLAGRRREDAELLPELPGLRLLGEVPDDELPGLYSGALATLYPSAYEGFGLPVVEAMSCGSPVIASRDPAVCEVSGGAALHVGFDDRQGWVEAIRCVLADGELRGQLRERSLRRAAEFSWSRTARETRAVYEEAMKRHGG